MSEPLGSLCIVLHAHIPYVLHHGQTPHGEAWLYEAAAESYLPLLDLIGEAALHQCRPALTVGLTPVLLEQLSQPYFKTGMVRYLAEQADLAAADRSNFEHRQQADLASLALRWEKWYAERLKHFQRIGRDIPGEFAARAREGHIQILTGPATHAYLPLLLNDETIRAQLACGTATSHRHLGEVVSAGMWLPECAYRPRVENWIPPVLQGEPRTRTGLDAFIAGAGVTHFCVDSALTARAELLGTMRDGHFRAAGEAQLHWDAARGWNRSLEPVGVADDPRPPECFALVRHAELSEQVWSSTTGYPGAGAYLDFHRKHNPGGLRYYKVTDLATPAADKEPYQPDAVPSKLYEHGQHFCRQVREILREHRAMLGKPGVCVAAFDAELFGHWWFEGPQFLRDVIFTLAHDDSVSLMTAEEALRHSPPEKVVRLPEGSWGEGADHHVWLNEQTRWMWEVEHRAERRMLKRLKTLPWQTNDALRGMLERAARELLLLQASDWPFVVHSKGAVDYGMQRFAGHATRFDRAMQIAENIAAKAPIGELERIQIAEMDAHDGIFAEIDLNWWT